VTATELNPRGTATREQFAAIMHRFDTTKFDMLLSYSEPVIKSTYTEKKHDLVTDADIYVSVSGSDENGDGTLGKPYLTLEKAIDAARSIHMTKTGVLTIALKAGDYGYQPFSLGVGDSDLTIRAYGDGEVILNGGVTLKKSDFVPLSEAEKEMFPASAVDSIRKVDLQSYGISPSQLGENNAVFCGERRLDNARYPNKSDDGYDAFVEQCIRTSDGKGLTLLPFVSKRINKYHNIDEMCTLGYYAVDWAEAHGKVEDYDVTTGTVYPKLNQYGIGDTPYFYFYNIPDELDVPDEYYIDVKTSTLYVFDPTEDCVISLDGRFLDLNGADNVSLVDLTFCYGTSEGIYVHDSDDFTLKHCTVRNIRGIGVRVDNSMRTLISECRFYDVGNRCAEFKNCGDRTTLTPANSVVDNCIFEKFGSVDKTNAPAIFMTGVGLTASHNEICNSSNIAIMFSEYITTGIDITVEYNYIHETVLQSSDSGAIYAGRNWATGGNKVRYNIIANTGNYQRNFTPFGIYLDDGMSGTEVYGNIIYNSVGRAFNINGGRDLNIHDNIIIGGGNRNDDSKLEFSAKQLWDFEKATDNFTKPFDYEDDLYLLLDMIPFRSDVWAERFPLVARIVYDKTQTTGLDIDDIDFPANPSYDTYKDNIIVLEQEKIDRANEDEGLECVVDLVNEFGTFEPSKVYNTEVNPCFADPTSGDYTVIDTSVVADNHFAEIGRY
ncbi:MAG: right-handed parallel beta-helix repeat-containing protein, partial [Clostridia bacterium]|nr:right-handed parallel beta-helix repeat-containing protein [Clostridia bacterium]